MADTLFVAEHPLIQHTLSIMRNKDTSTASFRRLLVEIAMLLGYEITRDLPLTWRDIQTPLTNMKAPYLEGKKVVVVSVLRAGQGMVDGMLQILPSARVGHVGLYRDPKTLEAVQYYFKMPSQMEDRDVIIVDPMLATGHTAVHAIRLVKETKPRSIKFMCLLAAPEGVQTLHDSHPDVTVYTAAVDSHLNEKAYIVPGLGDAGDRIYGTK
ncbi:MAG: uracil phosphoribosyltransferase [Myxococcota bacterium]|nr:uracil phosphoribosyltransferase [Myxococcota bacterium]